MKTLILLLTCLMLAPTVYAENLYFDGGQYGRVYKWADDYGNVHYTRQPPEYGDYSEINERDIVEKGSHKTGEGGATSTTTGGPAMPGEKMTAKEIIGRNCVIARNNLVLLQNARGKPLTYTNSEGATVNVDDKEKAARIKAAQDNIAHYCN